jgi:peptide/nickel transport system permease protein
MMNETAAAAGKTRAAGPAPDGAPAPAAPKRRRLRFPVLVVVSLLVLAFVSVCALAPGLVAAGATAQDILLGVSLPGTPGHLLGTDDLGRDILLLTLAGTRSAVLGPLVIAAGSMTLGILLGTPAGYFGGLLDTVVARWADLLMALPAVLLAIVIAGIVGGGYWVTVAIMIVLFSPSDVRLIRAGVLEQKALPYVESARVLRLPAWRIMFGQILPNVAPIFTTNFMLNIAYGLTAMSSLSYLGLGAGEGSPDWGRQLSDGQQLLTSNPAAVLAPGIMIVLTAVAVNLVGDWLGERLSARIASR